MPGRVAGKVALVTGGASGLGRASAILLAKEGAKVVVSDIAEAAGKAVEAEIGETARFVRHDVTNEADWRAVIEAAIAAFGGLHILVNSAGIGLTKDVEQTTLDEWHHVHAVDLDSVFLGCKHAIPAIRESGGGSIVNISSIAGIIGGANMAAYNSAKAGVRLLTKSVALHCAKNRDNIRCNSVHPTFIDTPILDPLKAAIGAERALEKFGRQIPLGRVGEPNDVAYGVLYLASDEAKFVTGAELVIDGGISAR